MNKPENIREQDYKIDITKMLYKGCKTKYDLAKFKTTPSFGNAIRNSIVMMEYG